MDEKKIILINLSKGRMGEQNADLIGSMLVVKIYLAAMSRADVSPTELQKLPNFYFYVDEFQSFANDTFADILSEARKYKLNLIIAHQYIEQLPEEVRYAVFGNAGTMIFFRVGAVDADLIEKELAPTFTAEDLVNLGIYQIYLKLMIDGLTSTPFSASTLPPLALPEKTFADEIIEASRKKYSTPRAEVEEMIKKNKEEQLAASQKPPVSKEGGEKKTKPWVVTDPQKSPQSSAQAPKKEFHVTKNPTEVSVADRKKQQAPVNTPKDNPKNSGERSSHVPFKKAFTKAEMRKDERSEQGAMKAMPLRTLKSHSNQETVVPSKNKGALQEVLAQALKESEKERQENSESHAQKIPEIPEQKLREILDGGDDK